MDHIEERSEARASALIQEHAQNSNPRKPPNAPRCAHAHSIDAKPRGYYSRLFGTPTQPMAESDEPKLIELGEAMRYTVAREGTLTPRGGFTYFGQFLGHDLTHDATPLGGPYAAPEQTPNYRTAVFDLDHVYGNGPEGSPYLYEGEKGAETFKIGQTVPGGYRRDLPIGRGGVLLGDLADRRNLDNLILRQIHVLFLKFHNEAVRQLQNNSALAEADLPCVGTLFERARRLVCWHYQWIIRHDYLPRVLHAGVWKHRLNRRAGRSFAVPIEFSLAAFRFGHSIARDVYRLNCRRKRVEIEDLMALGQRAAPLSDDDVVEWGAFFDGLPTSGSRVSSNFIDTSVSRAMHGLSPGTITLGSETEAVDPSNLPVRTLLRGARARLASGQEIGDALVFQGRIAGGDRLTSSELSRDTSDRSGSVLQRNGLQNNTPLFYYILKEAELKTGGLTLGPVGSLIVAEVIRGALESDPHGYHAMAGPRWKLPSWRFPNGAHRPVNSFIRIVQLVGDDKLLPGCAAHRPGFVLRAALS
jgi:Animal haem peroxidase